MTVVFSRYCRRIKSGVIEKHAGDTRTGIAQCTSARARRAAVTSRGPTRWGFHYRPRVSTRTRVRNDISMCRRKRFPPERDVVVTPLSRHDRAMCAPIRSRVWYRSRSTGDREFHRAQSCASESLRVVVYEKRKRKTNERVRVEKTNGESRLTFENDDPFDSDFKYSFVKYLFGRRRIIDSVLFECRRIVLYVLTRLINNHNNVSS